MPFLKSIKLAGLLSFPPDSSAVELTPLNVLIGPNGSGKSNLIEAIELLHAAPTAFAAAIRDGGGVQEWLWKGDTANGRKSKEASHKRGRESLGKDIEDEVSRMSLGPATIEAIVEGEKLVPDLRYRLTFAPAGQRTEVLDEVIEEIAKRQDTEKDVFFYYRFQRGRPILNVRDTSGGYVRRALKREDLVPDESVLSQRKGSDTYPEVTWLGQQFSRIQSFRDWNFGRYAPLREPQPADLPTDFLLPDARNLGLLLNELEHTNANSEFNELLRRFLPRYQRFSTRIQGGTVQFYLHESGLKLPIPATRLSDGTIRFMAILALLLSPDPPPMICIEEPELGLHPDAVSLVGDLLVDASARSQLIVTTHSDALVSALTDDASSVLVCDYRQGTQLERVDPEKLRHWLDQYRLGEIWRIGELGGNP
jgi:predicted ATPase